MDISIHAPLAGSDPKGVGSEKSPEKFQSTLPSQGATHRREITLHRIRHFNPRSPRRERHFDPEGLLIFCGISIHAPLAGSDRLTRGNS